METRHFGARQQRNEDARLLTGRAGFIDDIELPGLLHACFVRSPHAHADILSIDTKAALARDGVVAVFTAADLGALSQPGPVLVPPPPVADMVFHARTATPLAADRVRHVGEPVALVIAASRYVAEDACADVMVEYAPRAVAAGLEDSARPDAPRVHDDAPGNLAARLRQARGDYPAARAAAALVLQRRFTYDHGAAMPIETRGVVAQWDARAEKLTIWDTTQAPVAVRNSLAAMLGLNERQVRVVAPFIGGGFGPKIMLYADEILIPWVAMRLGCPVKWIEDRSEHFFSTSHERGQVHEAEIAFTEDGRILGIHDRFLHDSGAYDPYGLTIPINSQCTLLGPYVVPAYDSEFCCIFTNKPVVTPYRGAGRQHGVFVIERLLDIAARQLGIDRTEIRRRNFIPRDAFPYNQGLIYQDFTTLVYDSGDYEPILDRLKALIGYDDFINGGQQAMRAAGRAVGIGLVCYVEGTGIGPYEGARVQVQASGKVSVATGIGSQGQGHFTSFAQIVADQIGIDPSQVDIVTGDTDQFYWGAGTFASRGAVVAGNAINQAAQAVRQKIFRTAAAHFECAEADLVLKDGRVSIIGVAEQFITIGRLAQLANPFRGAVAAGTEPGLEATSYFGPPSGATAAGAHAMIVEIDRATLIPTILHYAVVHDCGTMINPLIVEGQIQGGVAQGIGNAFYEQLVFDDQAQLQNASLMDFLLPGAKDVPMMQIGHACTPSPLNVLGIKGVGEAGAIPGGALFAQAIEDALGLPERGIELRDIPLSPQRLWELGCATE
jgi:carbon-monoxide dehydrogenase large subunit